MMLSVICTSMKFLPQSSQCFVQLRLTVHQIAISSFLTPQVYALTAVWATWDTKPIIEASKITFNYISVDCAMYGSGRFLLELALSEFMFNLDDFVAFNDFFRATSVHISFLNLLHEMIGVLKDESAFSVLFGSNCKPNFRQVICWQIRTICSFTRLLLNLVY